MACCKGYLALRLKLRARLPRGEPAPIACYMKGADPLVTNDAAYGPQVALNSDLTASTYGRPLSWEVSSFCAGDGSCVEVARLASGDFAVRDGALGNGSPMLTFTREEWDAFVSGIKAGELQ